MILSEEEKNEMRPPFQLSKCLRTSGFSENSVEKICQIIRSIIKQQSKEVANQACLKGVELMEAGATEEEVIEALSKI